jgi:hexosaminidase
MSWVKINHLHWHVVDSQSFPLVVPGFEELSHNGAYSSAQVYTGKDVKDVVTYAAAVCYNFTRLLLVTNLCMRDLLARY